MTSLESHFHVKRGDNLTLFEWIDVFSHKKFKIAMAFADDLVLTLAESPAQLKSLHNKTKKAPAASTAANGSKYDESAAAAKCDHGLAFPFEGGSVRPFRKGGKMQRSPDDDL